MITCDKCKKEIPDVGGGLFGALQNLGGKQEFNLCKMCEKKYELWKLQFFE